MSFHSFCIVLHCSRSCRFVAVANNSYARFAAIYFYLARRYIVASPIRNRIFNRCKSSPFVPWKISADPSDIFAIIRGEIYCDKITVIRCSSLKKSRQCGLDFSRVVDVYKKHSPSQTVESLIDSRQKHCFQSQHIPDHNVDYGIWLALCETRLFPSWYKSMSVLSLVFGILIKIFTEVCS